MHPRCRFERQQTSNEIMEGAHVDRLARTGTGVRRHRMTLFDHSSTKHACNTKLSERHTASPIRATLFRTQNGSGFTTCKAHLDGFWQSCVMSYRGLDQSNLLSMEGSSPLPPSSHQVRSCQNVQPARHELHQIPSALHSACPSNLDCLRLPQR